MPPPKKKKKPASRGRPAKKPAKGKQQAPAEQEQTRVRLPKGKEVIGILDQRLGGSRGSVRCLDGKTRNCRIPGRLKKKLWVRPGDVVIIEPWEFGGETRGDIIFKYKPSQVSILRSKGYLEQLEDYEEF